MGLLRFAFAAAGQQQPVITHPYFLIFFTRLELEELDLADEDFDDVEREELDPVRETVDLVDEPLDES